MQPQEQQQIPAQQPVYYVPVQAVPAPAPAPAPAVAPAEKPRWAGDLENRFAGQSMGLAFIGLMALVNLILTVVLFVMIHGALHPFGG